MSLNSLGSSGLNLINNYTSDDESDNETSVVKKKVSERLPLPSAFLIQSQFVPVDNPDHHGGRVRSFPHERGNWASYIYIPYRDSDILNALCETIVSKAKGVVELKLVEDKHISLSRSFVLYHHWIDSFMKTLEVRLRFMNSFVVGFGQLSVYVNGERTRTFIGLDVIIGCNYLHSLVININECLKEFRLNTFYENPSFHMSIAWCVGDERRKIQQILPCLQYCFQQFLKNHPEIFNVYVTNYACKTGNKIFVFPIHR